MRPLAGEVTTPTCTGSPSPQEIRQLEALSPAHDLLELLRKPELSNIPEKDFQVEFSHVPPAASALLREMLRFNAEPPPAMASSPAPTAPLPAPLPEGWQQTSDDATGRTCAISPSHVCSRKPPHFTSRYYVYTPQDGQGRGVAKMTYTRPGFRIRCQQAPAPNHAFALLYSIKPV